MKMTEDRRREEGEEERRERKEEGEEEVEEEGEEDGDDREDRRREEEEQRRAQILQARALRNWGNGKGYKERQNWRISLHGASGCLQHSSSILGGPT